MWRKLLIAVLILVAVCGIGAYGGLSKLSTKEGRPMPYWQIAITLAPAMLSVALLVRLARKTIA
jgi:hypothetical protein